MMIFQNLFWVICPRKKMEWRTPLRCVLCTKAKPSFSDQPGFFCVMVDLLIGNFEICNFSFLGEQKISNFVFGPWRVLFFIIVGWVVVFSREHAVDGDTWIRYVDSVGFTSSARFVRMASVVTYLFLFRNFKELKALRGLTSFLRWTQWYLRAEEARSKLVWLRAHQRVATWGWPRDPLWPGWASLWREGSSILITCKRALF